jgi:carboxyl-terminal processing protease
MTSIGQSATKITGIGVALDSNPEGHAVIKNVIAHSPAEKAGLLAGDWIVSVQTDASSPAAPNQGRSLEDIKALIRGPLGIARIMNVRRDGREMAFRIVRGEVLAPGNQ